MRKTVAHNPRTASLHRVHRHVARWVHGGQGGTLLGGGVKWKAHSGSGVKNDRMPSRKKEMNKQEQKRKKKEKKERVEMGGGQNHVRQTW